MNQHTGTDTNDKSSCGHQHSSRMHKLGRPSEEWLLWTCNAWVSIKNDFTEEAVESTTSSDFITIQIWEIKFLNAVHMKLTPPKTMPWIIY